jgi:hypothetical protein
MSGSIGGLPPIPLFLADSANEAKLVAKFQATDPQTKADVAYFVKQTPKLTSVDALMKDYRALSIMLGAFGLSADLAYPALVRKVLTQDPTKSTSLAQQMASPAFYQLGKDMGQWKTPPFASAANVAAVVSAYATNTYEASQASLAPGLDTALYFRRTIGGITSINGLMSDRQLLSVVEAASNIPQAFGMLDYPQQVRILTKAVDLKSFKDPAAVNRMAETYLLQSAQQSSASGSDPTGALALLGGGSLAAGGTLLSLFA